MIPPIGKSLEDFFEEKQRNTLTTDFAEYILASIDIKNNGMFHIFSSGAKGKLLNI